jgi:hypothetical protein
MPVLPLATRGEAPAYGITGFVLTPSNCPWTRPATLPDGGVDTALPHKRRNYR